MKRNSFIKMCVAAGSMLTLPFADWAKQKETTRGTEAFKVDAGKDRFEKPITLFEGFACGWCCSHTASFNL